MARRLSLRAQYCRLVTEISRHLLGKVALNGLGWGSSGMSMLSTRAIFATAFSLGVGLTSGAACARAMSFHFETFETAHDVIKHQGTAVPISQSDQGPKAPSMARIDADLFAMTLILPETNQTPEPPAVALPEPTANIASLAAARVMPEALRRGRFGLTHGFAPKRMTSLGGNIRKNISPTRLAAVPVPPAFPVMALSLMALALVKRRFSVKRALSQ